MVTSINFELSVITASEQLSSGRVVLLIDDVAQQPCGYFIAPAISITTEDIAFIVRSGAALVCVAIAESRADELSLPLMSAHGSEAMPSFTVSVEARHGVTTGISAADRAKTIQIVARTTDPRHELVTPGHIFPIRTKEGGTLIKCSPPEAAVDLMRISDLTPAATIAQCLDSDGNLRTVDSTKKFAAEHGLATVTLTEIIHYQLSHNTLLVPLGNAELPTELAGIFRALCFRSKIDGAEHLALVKSRSTSSPFFSNENPVAVRVQAENRIGDLFGTSENNSRKFIQASLSYLEKEQEGAFIYIRHPKQGALQKQLTKTTEKSVPKQIREFGIGAQILTSLGIKKIKLLSNSKQKIIGIDAFGLEIVEQLPLTLERSVCE